MQKSKSETVRKEDSKNSTVKSFLSEHKAELSIAGGIACAAVLGYVGYKFIPARFWKSFAKPARKMAEEAVVPKEPVVKYMGVPLTELDALAKEMYHGIGCTIDKYGNLIFVHKSNRGHQTFRAMMVVENGVMKNTMGHYPGQWWSSADEFAKQASGRFNFAA